MSPCFSSDCLLFWSNWCHHVSPLFVFCVVLCFCALFGFVSCLVIVYLMLSVSLDCPFFIAPSCCQCLCIVHSLLPLRVVSVSVLSILYCPFVLSVSLYCPFFIAPSCCQCLCIVHSLLPLRVANVSGLSILYCPHRFFSNVYFISIYDNPQLIHA